MNWFKVSASHLSDKKLNSFLSVLLLSFGVGIILVMLIVNQQIENTFKNNIRGIDMVVGAKGSPLQIILSSVYHIDAPTGNISVNELKSVYTSPMVDKAIPLSIGDSHNGFRIIGSTKDFIDLYNAEFDQGSWVNSAMDVVLGYQTAQMLNLKMGDEFNGNHGLSKESIEQHDEHNYRVVGILKPSSSIMDRLIVTSLNSVWEVHHEGHDHNNASKQIIENLSQVDSSQQITSLLLSFKSQMALFSMPRKINQKKGLQAALPAIEVNRLIGLLGIGVKTLNWVALLVIMLSGASVFISLYNNLKEKKYEMALLRSFGASRFVLFRVVVQEGLMISLTGFLAGFVLSRIALIVINYYAETQFDLEGSVWSFHSYDLQLLGLSIGIGLVSAIIPAIRAYSLNISDVLSHE